MTTNQTTAGTAAMQSALDGLRAGVKPTAIIRGIDTHTLASGRTLAVPPQPHDDPRSEAAVLMAISALRDLDVTGQEVAGNRNLSDHGKADEVARRAVPHIQRIARQWSELDQQEADAQAREAQHFAVPPLKAGDAAQAVIDGQIRDRYSRMKPSDQNKVLASVRAGSAPDVATALKRSPFPMIDGSESLDNAWQQHRDAADPVARAEIDGDRASVNWARPVVRRVAEMATGISGMNKVQLGRALAPSYAGADLFGFNPRETLAMQQQDARRAAQAASSNALATGDA